MDTKKKKAILTFIDGELHLDMTETEAERAAEAGIFQLPTPVAWHSMHIGMPVAKVENQNAVRPSKNGQGVIVHGGVDTQGKSFFILHAPNLIVEKKQPVHETQL